MRLSPTPPALELRRKRTSGNRYGDYQHRGVLANAQQRSCEDLLNMFTCSDLFAAGVELDVTGD